MGVKRETYNISCKRIRIEIEKLKVHLYMVDLGNVLNNKSKFKDNENFSFVKLQRITDIYYFTRLVFELRAPLARSTLLILRYFEIYRRRVVAYAIVRVLMYGIGRHERERWKQVSCGSGVILITFAQRPLQFSESTISKKKRFRSDSCVTLMQSRKIFRDFPRRSF